MDQVRWTVIQKRWICFHLTDAAGNLPPSWPRCHVETLKDQYLAPLFRHSMLPAGELFINLCLFIFDPYPNSLHNKSGWFIFPLTHLCIGYRASVEQMIHALICIIPNLLLMCGPLFASSSFITQQLPSQHKIHKEDISYYGTLTLASRLLTNWLNHSFFPTYLVFYMFFMIC